MTTIGPQTRVEGHLSGDEDVTVYGRVDGSLSVNANVVIAEGGQIHGTLSAQEIIIRGYVKGSINASTILVLEESARVVADIDTASIRMEDGAQVSGDIIMDIEGDVPARPVKSVAKSTPKSLPKATPQSSKAKPVPKPKPKVEKKPKVEVIDEDEYEEIEDLSELTVKELRELCEDYDLSTKGTKAQLIARLEEIEE